MKYLVRLLTLIGLHVLASPLPAAQMPAGAQPPFEYQLWAADHVVTATVLRSGENVSYRLQKVLKGNPGTLKFREAQMIDVDDAMWRQLGRRSATGDSVLLLLRGPRTVLPAHSALESYLLGSRLQFTHVPEDASVRKTLSIVDVERMLREPPFDTRGCGRITLRGEYLLCTEVLYAGTRSEGHIGRLYRHGAEIKGEQKGQVVNLESASSTKFIFRGNERPYLWSVSGWEMDEVR